MKFWVICCVCGAVKQKGDPGAPISHSYCNICAANLHQQFKIWDMEKEDNHGIRHDEQTTV